MNFYDGNRVIQERDTNNTPTVSYTRGNDLSGSLEGAGGIGGLLARSDTYSSGNFSDHNYYHADGNGNVTYLETSAQGLAASYRYDAFGNTLSSSGTYATANTYRFSSKEWVAGGVNCYYYLYRFYSPSLQRWLNRDPIEENGGINLYEYVGNNPNFGIDAQGLTIYVCSRKTDWGVGNHTYLFDSSPPPGGCQSCGTSGSSTGSGSSSGSSSSCNKPKSPCPDGNEGNQGGGPNGTRHDSCQPIPEGGEDLMNDCKQNANNGIYIPILHDCHNSVNCNLKRHGYNPPTNPRFGPPHVGPITPR